MNKETIKQEIKSRVEISKTVNYSAWRVGLTHDPEARKAEHKAEGKDVTHWKQWQADSLKDAQDLESYFINEKKMDGGTGGNLSSNKMVYIYIH